MENQINDVCNYIFCNNYNRYLVCALQKKDCY